MPRTAIQDLTTDLRLLHAVPVALDPDKLPSELVILKWGDNETPDGIVKVGPATLRSLAANQKATNFDRVCLDYNHNTVPGSPFYKGEPNEVAAYGIPSVVEGVGLKLCSLEWTESAPKYVGGGHYRDLSPAIKVDPATNEVIFLHSAAVCRQGAVTGLILNSASSTQHKTKKENTMDPKKLLLTILGLADDASDQEIQDAAQKMGEKKEEKGKDLQEAAADKKEEGDKEPDVKALAATVKTLGENIIALTSRLDGEARAGIIALAASEGKVVPDEVKALPVDQLRTLCAKLPVTVPVKRETPEVIILSDDGAKVVDPVQRQVNANLGISDEQFAKHDKA